MHVWGATGSPCDPKRKVEIRVVVGGAAKWQAYFLLVKYPSSENAPTLS